MKKIKVVSVICGMLLATFIAVPHSKAVVSPEIEDYTKSNISGRCVDSGFCGIMDGNKIVFGRWRE